MPPLSALFSPLGSIASGDWSWKEVGADADSLFGTQGRGQHKDRLKSYLDQLMQGRQAPQAGQAAHATVSPFANNQRDLVGRLEAMASGRGPSLAAEQLKTATDRNQAAQTSIAAGGRGNAGLAGIMSSNTSAQLGQNAAQQATQGRIAEQQMALSQLGGVINQGRASDEGHSQFNALQTNFRDQFNVEAKLRTMGMNDSQIAAILQQLGQAEAAPTTMERVMAGLTSAGGQALGAKGQMK